MKGVAFRRELIFKKIIKDRFQLLFKKERVFFANGEPINEHEFVSSMAKIDMEMDQTIDIFYESLRSVNPGNYLRPGFVRFFLNIPYDVKQETIPIVIEILGAVYHPWLESSECINKGLLFSFMKKLMNQ